MTELLNTYSCLYCKRNRCIQGGRGTKIHVYLPYQGAIQFYVHIVPSGLINTFLDVECDKISCGLQPTRCFPEFSIKLYYGQKVEISDLFLGNNHLCHQKGDKKLHIIHYYDYFDFSHCC